MSRLSFALESTGKNDKRLSEHDIRGEGGGSRALPLARATRVPPRGFSSKRENARNLGDMWQVQQYNGEM